MMETKIYVVSSGEGEWEDNREWIEKAFRKKEDAEAYARLLDEQHSPQPVFAESLWEEAGREWYTMNEEKYGVDWESCPYDWMEEREKCDRFVKEQEKREAAFLLEYINNHSTRQYTAADIAKHQRYVDNQGIDWYPCRVDEVVLVE